MTAPTYPVMPGVPAMGHLAHGYWHPGNAEGCPKCHPAPSSPPGPPQCPVAGHQHELVHVRDHTQAGTGQRATTWECPTGRYRWFHIHRLGFNPRLRQDRPRNGWKKEEQ